MRTWLIEGVSLILQFTILTNLLRSSSSENDEELQEIYKLDPNSKYCTIYEKRITCKFHDTDMSVLLAAGLGQGLDYQKIEIHNATRVILEQVCIPSVQIFSTNNISTQVSSQREEVSDCRMLLLLIDSNASVINGDLKILRVKQSHISTLDLKTELDYFSLSMSTVEHLGQFSLQKNLPHTSIIDRCSIKRTSNMFLNSNFAISNSKFGIVEMYGMWFSCENKNCTVDNSVFERISEWGLTINGEVSFIDVRFESLDQIAITVEEESKVSFRNVRVENAEISSILIYDCSTVTFNNFTIGGNEIDCYSTYITSSIRVDDHHIPRIKPTTEEPRKSIFDQCVETKDEVNCNCHGMRPHRDDRLPDFGGKPITIERCYLLEIYTFCNGTLKMNRTSGSVKLREGENCNAHIEISNSYIISVKSRSRKTNLSLEVNDSRVYVVQIESVNRLQLRNVIILDLKKLNISQEYLNQNSSQKDEAIGTSGLERTSELTNVTITELREINIDIGNSVAIFKNVTIKKLHPGSLTVQSGKLHLKDVNFETFPENALYIGQDGQIQLERETPWPLTAYRFISVYQKEQVISSLSPTEDATEIDRLLFVRGKRQLVAKHLPENIVISDKQDFDIKGCWRHTVALKGLSIECDFNENSMISIDLVEESDKLNKMEFYKSIMIKNVEVVNAFPTSFEEIRLHNVKEINFLPNESSTLTYLQISSSYLTGLSGRVEKFNFKDTKLDFIELSNIVQGPIIVNSSLKDIISLHWKGQPSDILNTTIESVKRIRADSDWLMNNVHIKKVESHGITIDKNSISRMVQSLFGTVEPYGIVINGNLSIVDTTFERLDPNAIHLMNGKPVLYMKNVAVLNGSLSSFKLDSYCSVTLINVTIHGDHVQLPKRLQWIEKKSISSDDASNDF